MSHPIEMPVKAEISIRVMANGSVRFGVTPGLGRLEVLGLLEGAKLDYDRQFREQNTVPLIQAAPVGFPPN